MTAAVSLSAAPADDLAGKRVLPANTVSMRMQDCPRSDFILRFAEHFP